MLILLHLTTTSYDQKREKKMLKTTNLKICDKEKLYFGCNFPLQRYDYPLCYSILYTMWYKFK